MIKKIIIAALVVAPVIGGALYLYLYGVNIAFADEFRFVPMMISGHLPSLRELFTPNVDHIIAFPTLAYFAVGKVSAWSSLAVMWLSFSLVVMLYAVVSYFIFHRLSGWAATVACLIVGSALFHPVQRENILWGFQITFTMCFVFSLLSLFFLARFLNREEGGAFTPNLAIALACGVIASFSSLQGLLVWPIAAVGWLLVSEKKRLSSLPFWFWCLCGAAVWGIFWYCYFTNRVAITLSDRKGDTTFWELITTTNLLNLYNTTYSYFIGVLDNVCGDSKAFVSMMDITQEISPWGEIRGVLIAIVAVLTVGHFLLKRPRAGLFPFLVLLFGLGTLLLIAIGRGGNSLMGQYSWHNVQPESRYYTFALAVLWSMALYMAVLAQKSDRFRLFFVALSGSLALWFAVSIPNAVETTRDFTFPSLRRQQYQIQTMEFQPSHGLNEAFYNASTLFNVPADGLRATLKALQAKRLNAFADVPVETLDFAEKKPLEAVLGSMAVFELRVHQGKETTLWLDGWAYDPRTKMLAKAVYLKVGGRHFPLFYGKPQRAVANFFHDSRLFYSGFWGEIALSALPAGSYPLVIEVVNHDGLTYYQLDMKTTLSSDGGLWNLRSGGNIVENAEWPTPADRPRLDTLSGQGINTTGIQIDTQNDSGHALVISGWVYDAKTALPGRAVALLIGDHITPMIYRLYREEAFKATKNPKLAQTGFSGRMLLRDMPPGQYPVHVEMVNSLGTAVYDMDSGQTLDFHEGFWVIEKKK